MHKRYSIVLLLLFSLLSGCVLGSKSGSGSMQSYDGVSTNYVADGQTLASQAALEMARRYPPARTYLGLVKTATPFGEKLEADLRSQGFIVSTDERSAPLKLSYTLDEVQGESLITCYLQIRLSDGEKFGTVHQLNALLDAPSTTTPSVLLQDPVYTPPVIEEKPLADTGEPSPVSAALKVAAHTAASGHTAQNRTVYSIPPPYTVHTKGTASQIAQRNKVPVADFCRWNQTKPGVLLLKGQRVYLQEPPTTTVIAEPAEPIVPKVAPMVAPQGEVAPILAKPIAPALATASTENTQDTKTAEPLPTAETSTWAIEPGNLQAQLSAWSALASYQLIWKTQNDFEMESHARFQGDFLSAIRQLFAGLHRSGHALRVTVYQGNNVIEVSEE